MKAVVYDEFAKKPSIEYVDDPSPSEKGVVIKVAATGICRSDWHGWMGHDADIKLPHVPGHELAGTIVEIGKQVKRWTTGDRVTLPFVCGCGECRQCEGHNQQICDFQFQPGFTHWGSFAEYVAIDYADTNLVKLPEQIAFTTAASLGCRFVTSFRGIVDQGQVKPQQWVAIHGCGGVGLSAIMIANAFGAKVIGVDINERSLELARSVGAVSTINATKNSKIVEQIIDITQGGADLSVDALGSQQTCFNSIACLRKQGKHIQIGLMVKQEANSAIPLAKVIADELQIIGSHGMQAHRYDTLLNMILDGQLAPEKLIAQTVSLQESIDCLTKMDQFTGHGISVIDQF